MAANNSLNTALLCSSLPLTHPSTLGQLAYNPNPVLQSTKQSLFIEQDQKDFRLLRSSCSLGEILEAMKNPNTGLSFLSCKNTPLPATTFVSTEAVLWLLEHVEGVVGEREAVALMERMLAAGMVCHGSGNPTHPFLFSCICWH